MPGDDLDDLDPTVPVRDGGDGDDASAVLGALLAGWIEPGSRRRLLSWAGDDVAAVADVVTRAWRDGDLHHEAGMWWVPPTPAEREAGGAPTSGGDVAPGAPADALATAARLRELCAAGRPEEALALGFGAVAALVPGSAGDPAAEAAIGILGIATLFALLDAGRVHAALAAAEALHREVVERGALGAQGWCAVALASALLVTGRTLDARERFTEAVLVARWTADAALTAEARRALAFTYTVVGETPPPWAEPAVPLATGASTADLEPPGDAGPSGAGVGSEAEREAEVRARAWGEPTPGNLAALAEVAEAARRAGRYGTAAVLAADLAILGDARTARTLLQGLGELDGDLLPTLRPMVDALVARDPVGLAAHADRLETMGVLGLAAIFTLLAVTARLEAGEDGTEVRDLLATANRRAAGLQLGRAYLEPFRRLLPLREREAEIAELAAAGHTNKEIAARLVLSPRTVENHLYRVYDKLGVSGRDELADVLGH